MALFAIGPKVTLTPIVTSLSLCVFCYMVVIAAGPSFVNALRSRWQLVLVSVLAMAALGIGSWFGLDIGTVAGAFVGAGTATAPLILGVVLGALSRTGPISWTLPREVANTWNQFSLLIFLVAVGTGAGSGLITALAADWVRLVTGSGDLRAHALICVIGLRSVLKTAPPVPWAA